jgi:hypothetical protein
MKTGIVAFVLFTISALATDLTGNWSGSCEVDGGDHNVPQCFTLRQQGKSLSGSGGPDASEQYPIEKGSVEGNQITFQLTTGEWKFSYHLRQLSADTPEGRSEARKRERQPDGQGFPESREARLRILHRQLSPLLG